MISTDGQPKRLPILFESCGDRVGDAMTFKPMCRSVCRCFTAGAFLGLATLLVLEMQAKAQQPVIRIRHLGLGQMSAGDRAALEAHRADILEGAEIYGYNLVAGNWGVRQTLCPSMPSEILVHYSQRFPDGTESLFTALVPRGKGRVRIVPVLHRNATPYLPAPRNPHNYALFNSLVPQSIAQRDLASSHKWIDLSACYAEMTGASILIPEGGSVDAGVAGAPTATIQLDSQRKTSLVTFADRESRQTFRVWSISFNRRGQVTAAGTEDYPVALPPVTVRSSAVATGPPEIESTPPPTVQSTEGSVAETQSAESSTAPSVKESMRAASASAALAPKPETPEKAVAQASQNETSEPGWKFIPEAPPPPSKFIRQAPQPRSKVVPQPKSQ